MKHRLFLSLTVIITLVLPCQALSAERSVIIGFNKRPGLSERALIHEAKGVIKRSYHLIHAMSVNLPERQLEKLRKNRRVAYIENDEIITSVEPLPGDEYINDWGIWHIGAYEAHSSGNRGTGVKIAVIDTGIDYTHEDLDDNYAGGFDFVFDDFDPYDDNTNSHGTHVSGIIAAEENGTGVIGVAPEAELYALKVLDGAGFGLTSWVIAAIEWGVDNGIQIANLSLEGPDSQALQNACDSAYSAGVLLIAAGGNTIGGSVRYPAGYDSVVAVTATDADDISAWFSPVGPEVELSAPGISILSTVTGGGYDFLSGTSQAAPHVAGAAALFVLSNTDDFNGDGVLNNEDVRLKLQITAVDLGETGLDSRYGFGLVNAAAVADTCEVCLADCDNNTKVDIFDLAIMKNEYNRRDCDIYSCTADFDNSSIVDVYDLNIIKNEFSRRDCCLQK